MIVLDEQLLGRNIETEIEKWYKGVVRMNLYSYFVRLEAVLTSPTG